VIPDSKTGTLFYKSESQIPLCHKNLTLKAVLGATTIPVRSVQSLE